MTTLKEAIQAIQSIQMTPRKARLIADEFLGKYKGLIPKGKTSNQYLRELRDNLYGKVKPS